MARMLTVPELLAARAAETPSRVAMSLFGGSALTFSEWENRAGAVMRALPALGTRPGDRIGLLFDSAHWLEFAVVYCGVLKAGAVAVPMSGQASPAEIEHMLTSSGATLVVCAPPVPSRPATSVPYVAYTDLDLDGGEAAPAVEVEPGDLAQILYTSGTSGRPKGVAASHGNLTHGCDPAPRRRAFAHSEHFVHAFPIGTNAGQLMLLNALVAHPGALVLERFDADGFCAAVEEHAVGTAFIVPAMAIDLIGSAAAERRDVSSVRMLSSSGSTLSAPVAHSLAKIFPRATIINCYTSTEAMPAQVMLLVDADRPRSSGLPLGRGSIRIADENGRALPTGETGEVWLRCPAGTRTYFGDPEATERVFRDGWVRMGDVGRFDADGHLHLLDRESDIIRSGAVKISTVEVETALREHPFVRDVAVVGLAHPVMQSQVAAVLVLDSARSLREVRAFARDRLTLAKVPVRWLVVDELPRNRMGKVVKRELRGMFAGQEAVGDGR